MAGEWPCTLWLVSPINTNYWPVVCSGILSSLVRSVMHVVAVRWNTASTIAMHLVGVCYAFVCSTILAVSGDDFAVVASDTRLSEGFMIHSRDSPKTYRLLVIVVLSAFTLHYIIAFLTCPK